MYKMIALLSLSVTLVGSIGHAGLQTGNPNRPEVADRDKTGTTSGPKNSDGPQTLVFQASASRLFSGAEGTGLEPATGFPAPHFQSDSKGRKTRGKRPFSETCQQIASSNGPIDADLAVIIDAWPTLPAAVKAGILAIVKAS